MDTANHTIPPFSSNEQIPTSDASDSDLALLLNEQIPAIQDQLIELYIKVQGEPNVSPPDDPDLAGLLGGLTIIRRDIFDLEVALYKYLTGRIDTKAWLTEYGKASLPLKFAAFEAVRYNSVTHGRIIDKALAEMEAAA